MATKKKMLQAAAGNAGGAGLDIDEVFSTYLYTGTSGSPGVTATNGIDLAGEGGLVWLKSRSNSVNHSLFDTERGGNSNLATNVNDGSGSLQMDVFGGTVFNSDGFFLRSGNGTIEASGYDYASWTFRKAPKFFDVVTYSGNSTPRTISHNLGTTVGTILIKKTSAAADWIVYHRSTGATDYLELNNDSVVNTYNMWNNTAPTSTEFSLSGYQKVNETGHTYVAYLFAHNNGDGEFGPDGDADIIKCGSYTGNGSTDGPEIDLGFEPQFIIQKAASRTGVWRMWDSMRHLGIGNRDGIFPSSSAAEDTTNSTHVNVTPTGFKVTTTNSQINESGGTYIYVAIRRPTAVPTSATEVFEPAVQGVSGANPTYPTGIVTDFSLTTSLGVSDKKIMTRLLGATELVASDTSQEGPYTNAVWDYMNGWGNEANQTNKYSWAWKRAPNYFDVVAYTGNGSKQTIAHNLGVAPEMMWIKVRSTTQHWAVYHPDLPGSGKFISLNNNWDGNSTNSTFWDGETPTSTTFSVGATGVNNNYVNGSPNTYIAYLFASLAGISKVGSATHSGTTNVDCGFSAGARFVLLKRTDATGDWYVWDSERGIVSGNDPYLLLNTTGAEVTNTDLIDPLSSGFTITSSLTAGDYIFYAIA
jgi:hypothetical protein